MTKSNRSDKEYSAADSFSEVHRTWAIYLSNIYGWATTQEDEAVSVSIKCRGPADWIGIAKRVGPDGGPQVLFGVGFDFVACVVAVNGAMAAGRWKVDKPYSAPPG